MQQTIGVKVPFTMANAGKCICGRCPVQANSQCVKEKLGKISEVMTPEKFVPEAVPGLYCSSGMASCQDLDTSQNCICPGCPVFSEYSLDRGQPTDHYCKNGQAK
jgi:hypothetical protein